MTIVYIGLGSNLNQPEQQLSNAFILLEGIPSTRLLQCSSFYQSKPAGPSDQPDYINAVVELDTGLTPFTLLEHLQEIENKHGRDRTVERWGPRILDLDILMFGDIQLDEINLIVPHPEIINRNFVLSPLLEISHDLNIPGIGRAQDLLDQIGITGLQKVVNR